MMIRILIVDDHDFIRSQLVELLGAVDDIEVVGECSAGEQVVDEASRVHPDVVLMDVQMGKMSGVAATRALLSVQPATRVLIMTGAGSAAVQKEAVTSGARGLLLKGGHSADLLAAVRTVAAGGSAWPTEPGK